MEEEIISGTTTKSDVSESKSSNSPPQKPKPSSRYKGVVPQANGHWGVQIYANHHRIWLGTFKTEDLAAAAYDSAAIKLRHGNSADPHRNFPLNEFTCHEPAFQTHYTTDQVLNMIKDGSYQTKFYEFLSISQVNGAHRSEIQQDGYFCKELFRKEMTPSDVGKLNRLVIPKRYALKYFNLKELQGQDFGVAQGGVGSGEDLELVFFDKSMRNWKFRYCYWQSSSSYVFTRGWNGFVKVKKLKAKDIVAFYMCELREKNNGQDVVRKFYMIDIVGCNASGEVNEGVGSSSKRDLEEDDVDTSDDELQAKKARVEEEAITENQEKGFKLFGVQILPEDCSRMSSEESK